jgi:hypothetical protein
MNRKQRRAMTKQAGANASDAIASKMSGFSKLPDKCSACTEPFDKKDKEMVQSWNVVVHQEVVRLFCPQCIAKAKGVLEDECE